MLDCFRELCPLPVSWLVTGEARYRVPTCTRHLPAILTDVTGPGVSATVEDAATLDSEDVTVSNIYTGTVQRHHIADIQPGSLGPLDNPREPVKALCGQLVTVSAQVGVVRPGDPSARPSHDHRTDCGTCRWIGRARGWLEDR